MVANAESDATVEQAISAARHAGDYADAMRALLAACEGEPRLALEYTDLAAEAQLEAGSELAFAWACAELRAYTFNLPIERPEWVRERYQELLAAHRGEPAQLALLRRVGLRIGELEATGALPQSLVVRTR